MHDIGLKALAMLCTGRTTSAALGSQDHRHTNLSTKHIPDLCRLIGQLVHRHANEIDIHQFRHRAQT